MTSTAQPNIALEQELAALRAEKNALEQQVKRLSKEKLVLEILQETTADHADAVTDTLRDKAEEALQESERRLAKFMEAMPVGVYVINQKGLLYYANRAALQIVGKSELASGPDGNYYSHSMAEEIFNHALGFLSTDSPTPLSPADQNSHFNLLDNCPFYLIGSQSAYPPAKQPVPRALKGEYARVDDLEIQRGEQRIPLEITATPIFDDHGEVIYAIAVLQDITERKHAEAERVKYIQEIEAKNAALRVNETLQAEIRVRERTEQKLQQANEKLEKLASLDGLTQIANRRSMEQHLALMWRQTHREQKPISLVMCDVDYFKRFNDTYGHQAGDDCLYQVAQSLAKFARRPTDMAARYGGEEFVLILPYTDIAGAMTVAKQFNAAVRALQISHSASDVCAYVSVSVGVSSMVPNSEKTGQLDLIANADSALYSAKKQGRNQVVSFVGK
jgi:diguanylate cyclase (GGDEF)-like protein